MRLNHVYLIFARYYKSNAASIITPFLLPKTFKKCQTETTKTVSSSVYFSKKEEEEEKRTPEAHQLAQPLRLMSLPKFRKAHSARLGLLGFVESY